MLARRDGHLPGAEQLRVESRAVVAPAKAIKMFWAPRGGIQKLGVRRIGVRRLCEFQGAQDAQVRGQLAQVGQVDGSVDFRGCNSSCSRSSRCFKGGGGIQHSGVRRRFTVLVGIGQY